MHTQLRLLVEEDVGLRMMIQSLDDVALDLLLDNLCTIPFGQQLIREIKEAYVLYELGVLDIFK